MVWELEIKNRSRNGLGEDPRQPRKKKTQKWHENLKADPKNHSRNGPGGTKLVLDKLKPETFGQNFRSKLRSKLKSKLNDPNPIQFL